MAIRKSSNSGIPFGNTSGRPTSPGTGQPYFNGELQRLELYTGAEYGWQNIVAETPGVTGYSGTISETTGGTITITGTNFASGATATLVGSDGTEYIATTTTVSNLTSISATFGALSASIEPYDIKVTNPSNLYGVYYDILTVNDKPIWSTAAGSLGTVYGGASTSFTLSATDEENNSLNYSLTSGSLPTGLSLSSSGVISGTPSGSNPSVTTYNFTVSVSDGVNTAQTRSFSLVYAANPVVTGGTLSSDSTYYYRTFTGNGTLSVSNASINLDYLVIAGGGAGGGAGSNDAGTAAGGGAGGYLSGASSTFNTGSYTVTIGAGGAGGQSTSSKYWNDGINSSLIGGSVSVTATGGGKGDFAGGTGGGTGGSGGGSSANRAGGSRVSSPIQGNNGGGSGAGVGGSNSDGSGGGGGAGSVGGNGTGTASGSSGAGGSGSNAHSSWLSAITPQMTGVSGWSTATSGGYIAGGGGGGGGNGYPPGAGGAGGGTAGGQYGSTGNSTSNSATQNTGSGSGASGTNGNTIAGNGGSGIVIVRYTKSQVGG